MVQQSRGGSSEGGSAAAIGDFFLFARTQQVICDGIILLEGNPPKPGNPYPFGGKPSKAREPLLWTDQRPTDQRPTN